VRRQGVSRLDEKSAFFNTDNVVLSLFLIFGRFFCEKTGLLHFFSLSSGVFRKILHFADLYLKV